MPESDLCRHFGSRPLATGKRNKVLAQRTGDGEDINESLGSNFQGLDAQVETKILQLEVEAQRARRKKFSHRRGARGCNEGSISGGECNEQEVPVHSMGGPELLESLSSSQRLGLSKCNAAVAWLEARLSAQPEAKFVVFAYHIVVLNTLHHILNHRFGLKSPIHRFFQGSTDDQTRTAYLAEFRTSKPLHNPKSGELLRGGSGGDSCSGGGGGGACCRVMLMSLQAGSVGIDLTAAADALFVQLPRDVAQLHQAEARIHRKGQRKPCEAHFLLSDCADDKEILAWERLR